MQKCVAVLPGDMILLWLKPPGLHQPTLPMFFALDLYFHKRRESGIGDSFAICVFILTGCCCKTKSAFSVLVGKKSSKGLGSQKKCDLCSKGGRPQH